MGGCQNYGPFLGPCFNTGPNTGPNLGDPKRDHNFDNHPSSNTSFFEALLGRLLCPTSAAGNEILSKLLKGELYRGFYRVLL